jgi:hypothetical protein
MSVFSCAAACERWAAKSLAGSSGSDVQPAMAAALSAIDGVTSAVLDSPAAAVLC